ncbi:MAG: NAD(P)-binding protein [Candidatus Hermodarchaeota archaeon]
MIDKVYETIIIGAGIAGLACARRLQEKGRDFLIISKDIGGRVLTSTDGRVNYGAFFVCLDYQNMLKYVKLKSRIKLSDFCFHKGNKKYFLFEPKLIRYSLQFIKVLYLLYEFRKAFRKFRQVSETISQKTAIEKDAFLYELYLQKADIFVKKQKIQEVTDTYLAQGLYSTTFSKLSEMSAFCFLQYLTPIITPTYTFSFEKERMIKPFKDKILLDYVNNISYNDGHYKVTTDNKIFYAKNIVLATEITISKKFADVKKTNAPVDTHMLHIKGIPKNVIAKKNYQLFTPPSSVQAMARLEDGTYLFYYKNERPSLKDFFKEYSIVAHKHWDPAGTINGHTLIESNRGNNLYLIGDFNVCGLEDTYITGIYAANQIINSK